MPKHVGERFIQTKKPIIPVKNKKSSGSPCPYDIKCGGCQLIALPYEEQLKKKQAETETLFKKFKAVAPIIRMAEPFHYKNKIDAVMDFDRKGNVLSGVYQADIRKVVPIENCLAADKKCNEILASIRELAKSFKYKIYANDTGYGLLRHVLIRRGFVSGEIMVVLVLSSPILPSKNNFVKALRKIHPEITTILLNINNRKSNVILGDKESILYGKGYIEDSLGGFRFRITSKSYYPVNPVQSEITWQKAVEFAGLTGKERVLDLHCGIGACSLLASANAGEVIGVDSNKDAIKDAITNAKLNEKKNLQFFRADASEFIGDMIKEKMAVDVAFLTPARAGIDEKVLGDLVSLAPKRIVYISCNSISLERDLQYLTGKKYQVRKIQPVDMFPMTGHVETVVLLERKG